MGQACCAFGVDPDQDHSINRFIDDCGRGKMTRIQAVLADPLPNFDINARNDKPWVLGGAP